MSWLRHCIVSDRIQISYLRHLCFVCKPHQSPIQWRTAASWFWSFRKHCELKVITNHACLAIEFTSQKATLSRPQLWTSVATSEYICKKLIVRTCTLLLYTFSLNLKLYFWMLSIIMLKLSPLSQLVGYHSLYPQTGSPHRKLAVLVSGCNYNLEGNRTISTMFCIIVLWW